MTTTELTFPLRFKDTKRMLNAMGFSIKKINGSDYRINLKGTTGWNYESNDFEDLIKTAVDMKLRYNKTV